MVREVVPGLRQTRYAELQAAQAQRSLPLANAMGLAPALKTKHRVAFTLAQPMAAALHALVMAIASAERSAETPSAERRRATAAVVRAASNAAPGFAQMASAATTRAQVPVRRATRRARMGNALQLQTSDLVTASASLDLSAA